jgi:hypothetical protein
MKLLLLCFLAAATLAAQNTQTREQREARHHFDLTATRAAANFRSADSIEANLRRDGQVLHPQLIALRLRIEAELSEAHFELDQHDYPATEDALRCADAFLDRFARQIGGY